MIIITTKENVMSNTNKKGIGTSALRAIRRNTRRVLLEGFVTARKRQADRPPPDFVIVGAQRCGTTSLFRALNKHRAMMPNVINAKGIHYFDTNYHRDLAWYLAHFPSHVDRDSHATKVGHKAIVGEASPYYLFHPAGAERMAQAIPGAKIIVLLRDPVKRAISHHLHMVFEHYSYTARGHYASQLEKFFEHYDRNNVLVMTTDKLISDSQSSLSTIQSFIGLEPDPSIQLEKRNASSSFQPKPETIQHLTNVFAESNKHLAKVVDIEIPW